jgi:hypothetical protein
MHCERRNFDFLLTPCLAALSDKYIGYGKTGIYVKTGN